MDRLKKVVTICEATTPWSIELIVIKSMMKLNVSPSVHTLKSYFDIIHKDFCHWTVGCNIEFVGDPGKYLPICLEAVTECKIDYDIAIRCIARGILLYIFPHYIDPLHPTSTLIIKVDTPHKTALGDDIIGSAVAFINLTKVYRNLM